MVCKCIDLWYTGEVYPRVWTGFVTAGRRLASLVFYSLKGEIALIRSWGKKHIACFLMAVCGWVVFFTTEAAESHVSISNPVSEETISIAVLNNFPPFSFLVRGKIVGFTIDYLDLLSRETGMAITLVPGRWEENLSKFKNGEVDAITAISHTVERESFTWFTTPYYLIPTVVYIRENSFPYNGVKSLQGRRVGIESDIYYKAYLELYPDMVIVEIDDTSDLMKKLSFGDIDAVVTNINIGNFMIKQHLLENIILAGKIDIPEIEDEDLRIGVRKDKKQVYALLQQAMNRIPFPEYSQLQDRWIGVKPKDIQETLMSGDREFINAHIKKHGGVRLSFNENWYPVDFVDEQKRHAGICAHLFEMMSDVNDIPMIEQFSGSFDSMVASVLQGKSDVIPAIVPDPGLESRLIYTQPYLMLPLVIATRSDQFFVGGLEHLSGEHISLLNRGHMISNLKKKYPSPVFVEVDSAEHGLTGVQNKEFFAFLGTVPSIAYAIKHNNLYNIKISGTLEEALPVCAAVRSGNETLAAVMDIAAQSIPEEERKRVVDRWISISLEEKVDYTLVWQILMASGMILVVAVVLLRKTQSFNREISKAYDLLEEKNKALERLSITDPLTDLYNRHKLDMEYARERKRSNRYHRPFSLVIIDIDHFKFINDRYGHQVGDVVLKKLGELIKQRTRSSDITGRWGGEEFLIICPETDRKGAWRLAEELRKDVEAFRFLPEVTVTISGGVAEYQPGEDGDQLLKRADDNLYKAKDSSRNMICG